MTKLSSAIINNRQDRGSALPECPCKLDQKAGVDSGVRIEAANSSFETLLSKHYKKLATSELW